MAREDDILNEKLDRIESVPDKLIADIENAEKGLVKDINLIIGQFERDGSGLIQTNERNLALLERLKPELEQVFTQSEYIDAVRTFSKELDRQGELSGEYYQALVDYSESSTIIAMTQQNKQRAVSMLLEGAIDAQFYDPIVDVMREGVYTNAPFREIVKDIEIITQGGEHANGGRVYGRLSRYARQVAYDTMAITDRTYNQQVTKELGLEFYRYTGGTMEDTRDFCEQRNGQVFHKKEVEDWAALQWDGKHRSTNTGSIFTLLGGYNCRHSIIPVPISQVPESDIRRNLSNGNLTLNQREREILGI